MEFDRNKQFETLAAIRAYADEILSSPRDDTRPSSARRIETIVHRMANLVAQLETRS